MHPYAPPHAPLLRPDPVFELRRAGRRVGLGAVAVVVLLATGWAARTVGEDPHFLAVHAACALAALLPVGLLGGPHVAFQGAGTWLRWSRAVAQVALLGLACGALGVLLGGRLLILEGHPRPYADLGLVDFPAWLWLGMGCACLALALAGLAGLILRALAQEWIQRWAPDFPEPGGPGPNPAKRKPGR